MEKRVGEGDKRRWRISIPNKKGYREIVSDQIRKQGGILESGKTLNI